MNEQKNVKIVIDMQWLALITLCLVALKVFDVIAWSWWIVFMPIWLPILLVLLLIVLGALVA